MPRSARLDAPGVLHHVIIRGIERRDIFEDNRDRDNLLKRLGELLPATHTSCYAWALLSNHAAPHPSLPADFEVTIKIILFCRGG
jgi:putative transposase